jgi:hypothetical protein
MLALALTALAAAAPPPVTVHRIEFARGDRTETRLVARDRRSGRRTVLARGRMHRRRGSVVGGWSVAGRRVAYVKSRAGPKWTVVRLRVVRVGRSVDRLETLRLFRVRTGREVPLDAVITSRGELAWLTPQGVFMRRPGRRPRAVSHKRYFGVELEDDRTLRLAGFDYIDLRPAPKSQPRCARRERFRSIFTSREVIVTRAIYDSIDEIWMVVRACRRATGRDPVVERSQDFFPDGSSFDVAGADRDWAVVLHTRCGRDQVCESLVRASQAGTARQGPGAVFSDIADEYWLPPGRELAVSDAGVPVWVHEYAGVARLVVVHRRGEHAVLDTGAAGSIRDLGFSGSVLYWRHDGVPRSTDLSPG